MEYDSVIIGGGAAGLSAALVLSRARRKVLLVDSGSPRNAKAQHLHGFLSRDGMAAAELLDVGRREVLGYGTEIVQARVDSISTDLTVHCDNGIDVLARAVVVATGLRDELPAIAGLAELWGRKALHCPYCHGYEVREGALGVIGGENRPFSIHQASLVRQWSEDVVFFPGVIELELEERRRLQARGVYIAEGAVHAVEDDGDGVSVVLEGGAAIRRSAVFVGPRFLPRHDLLVELGCAREESGWIETDAVGTTSVPGVWAAGNVADSPAQIINAASAGSRSAIAVNHYLLEQDIVAAVSARY